MKRYSDSTLQGMTKAELIDYIRVLEHNWGVAEEMVDQQVKNFLVMENQIVEELERSAITMSTESVPHKYFKAVSVKRATQIVRRGGRSYGSK